MPAHVAMLRNRYVLAAGPSRASAVSDSQPRHSSHSQLFDDNALAQRRFVDGLEVKVNRFADILASIVQCVSFRDAPGKLGDVDGVPAFIGRLKYDSLSHGHPRCRCNAIHRSSAATFSGDRAAHASDSILQRGKKLIERNTSLLEDVAERRPLHGLVCWERDS